MPSSEFGAFESNVVRVNDSDVSSEFAVRWQASTATRILRLAIAEGRLSGQEVRDEVHELAEVSLGDSRFLDMVTQTGKSEDRDANVRAVGVAAAFLSNVAMGSQRASLIRRVAAKLRTI